MALGITVVILSLIAVLVYLSTIESCGEKRNEDEVAES